MKEFLTHLPTLKFGMLLQQHKLFFISPRNYYTLRIKEATWYDSNDNKQAIKATPNQNVSIRCYLSSMTNSMQKAKSHLILSRYSDDKWILQSDWTRGTTGHTQLVVLDATFFIIFKIWNDSFQSYWWSKNPTI